MIIVSGLIVVLLGLVTPQEPPKHNPGPAPSSQPDKAATQPASSPASAPASQPSSQATSRASAKRPEQVRLFEGLLQKANEPGIISPQGGVEAKAEASPSLLPEGTTIAERAGKLVRSGEHWEFQFFRSDVQSGLQGVEILKSAFLDQMERLAQTGVTDFVVSGEMTTYRGQNFLLIRKVRRHVDHGNLAP